MDRIPRFDWLVQETLQSVFRTTTIRFQVKVSNAWNIHYFFRYGAHTQLPFYFNVSISSNRLSTSVHYKPTDSQNYLLHSSSHPAHVKNSIPYSQFLRLRRLCSDDTDFSEKAEEMCQFFKTRGYPDPVIHNSKHRAQSVHPQSAPLSSHNKIEGRIPLTLTFHPHNISVKNIILKNFKLLQHDPTTAEIFAQPLLISYKRDKNLRSFLVRSTLKSDHQPGTFQMRTRTM